MVKKIKFIIEESGEVKLEVLGVQGEGCEEFSAPFEEHLGTTKNKKYKDSFYQNVEESKEQYTEES